MNNNKNNQRSFTNGINEIPVILSKKIVDNSKWVQAKTHKKKRINKKWRKRYGMIHPPSSQAILIDNKLYVHPLTWKKMKKQLNMKLNDYSSGYSAKPITFDEALQIDTIIQKRRSSADVCSIDNYNYWIAGLYGSGSSNWFIRI